jgi:hypothetical protein
MGIGSTDTVRNASPQPSNSGATSPKQVKEFDNERAKAIADAEAVAARIDQDLANADKDDEPDANAARQTG